MQRSLFSHVLNVREIVLRNKQWYKVGNKINCLRATPKLTAFLNPLNTKIYDFKPLCIWPL